MRLQLVLREDWQGNTRCLVAQDLALLIKVRTLIHEEISVLTVFYFPFRARTPLGVFGGLPGFNCVFWAQAREHWPFWADWRRSLCRLRKHLDHPGEFLPGFL